MSLSNIARMISSRTEIKPEDKFLFELGKTMQQLEEGHPPSRTFKPSSLSGCMRMIYFQITGAEEDEEPSDAELIAICENGTDRHERLQDWVSKMNEAGFNCEWIDVETYLKEHPVTGTYVRQKIGNETKCANSVLNMSFMCDGIIKYDGVYYILEIKTESNYKHNTRVGAEPNHVVQATCYSVCLGIDKVMFLYEERNFCNKKCYIVEVDDEMKTELVISKIETTNNFIMKEEVPPKSDKPKDCTYCEYKKECAKW